MGLIIAVKENDHIVIGSDSDHLIAAHGDTFLNWNNYKFWRVPGHKETIMAYVGPYKRIANVLKVKDDLLVDKPINYRTIVKDLVPTIVEINRRLKLIPKDKHEVLGRYLVATGNKLYVIDRDGYVSEQEECVTLGNAKRNAYGSLRTTRFESFSSKDRILHAMMAGREDDYKVSFPVIIGRTNSDSIETITRNVEYRIEKGSGGKVYEDHFTGREI